MKSRAVGLCCLFASIIVCLGACSPKHSSYSEFSDVPATGWTHNSPLYFTPQYGDSAACYDISVAIRHDQDYAYRNLSITADFIGDNQKLKRRIINVELADKYGTWKGSGFGALYQFKQVVLEQVPAHTVKRIVLWQTMSNRDTVGNITDVGIIVSPSREQ
ncbi:MAG: gliding motility lipoprotein GldH [Muribaculaceae bacterium]